MVPFRYTRAADVDAARASALRPGSRLLAGGTTLVDLLKLGVERPAELVDVGSIGLTDVEELASGGLRLGALVRNSDLAAHALVHARYPLLAQAILAGASPQIRNMATTAGNLLQRTRCAYFRDTASMCNKREPGTGCGALEGENRGHAVLGTSEHCIATHPSDLCVALVALDAVVRLAGATGERTVPATDFHLVPGGSPAHENVLEPGEVVLSVDLPPPAVAGGSAYVKVRDRASFAFALAAAAAVVEVREGVVRATRMALGGVATKPWRCFGAERTLVGAAPADESFRAAAEAALEGSVPRAHNAFKIELAKRTLVRALRQARDQA